jgi:type II secretory pathway component PulC
MSTSERPASPRRWTRTLPWLAGLLLGTAAHVVWWTSTREPEVRVVTVDVPSRDVHVHVHAPHGERAMPAPRPSTSSAPRSAIDGARGAVVCSPHGCTIRRSFVERLLHDPGLLGPAARVEGVGEPGGPHGLRVLGVYPGSVADLLGLRNGDVIVELDGRPMRSPEDLGGLGGSLGDRDGIALTLHRGALRQTLRYRVIDG